MNNKKKYGPALIHCRNNPKFKNDVFEKEFTVAIDKIETGVYNIAMAFVHKPDHFNKKQARVKALGRAKSTNLLSKGKTFMVPAANIEKFEGTAIYLHKLHDQAIQLFIKMGQFKSSKYADNLEPNPYAGQASKIFECFKEATNLL